MNFFELVFPDGEWNPVSSAIPCRRAIAFTLSLGAIKTNLHHHTNPMTTNLYQRWREAITMNAIAFVDQRHPMSFCMRFSMRFRNGVYEMSGL
ncbi:MAG: hypothetical protein F6K30_27610 [Cyanothece sp. SIO2G6]|nr:hypothetical protein [Cyanothece sp. SIO2G6]